MKTTLLIRPGPPGHAAPGHPAGAVDDLLHDLGRAEVALQTALTGGAERAGHPAAGLARDAHRRPVRVAHQHALDRGPVEQPPQRLDRGPAVAGLFPYGAQQLGQELRGQHAPGPRRADRSTRPGRRATPRSSAPTAAGPGTRADRPPRRTPVAAPASGRPSVAAAPHDGARRTPGAAIQSLSRRELAGT